MTSQPRRKLSPLLMGGFLLVLAAPDRRTWTGRRDHAVLVLSVQTGPRASELQRLHREDIHPGTGACVSCRGKGRKQRVGCQWTPTSTNLVSS